MSWVSAAGATDGAGRGELGIITGTGRFFSAGWDLGAANDGETVDADHGPGGFAGLTEYFSLTKPVIAAVNGLAVGGGFELALAADLIIASTAARFWLPEAQLGMLPDSGGLLRLPKAIPARLAREMILTGRRLEADEALALNLVNRVVEPEGLLASAMELAKLLARFVTTRNWTQAEAIRLLDDKIDIEEAIVAGLPPIAAMAR